MEGEAVVMRWLLCFAIACSASSKPAPENKPVHLPDAGVAGGNGSGSGGGGVGGVKKVVIDKPFSLDVLGIEVIGAFNATSARWAKDLTSELVAAAREYDAIKMGAAGTKHLVDEKLMMNCQNEAPPCMAGIAKNHGVDRLVYGRIDGTKVTIKLIVAETQVVVEWNEPGFDFSSDVTIRAGARAAMASLLSRSP
jgi:hypothetical protein